MASTCSTMPTSMPTSPSRWAATAPSCAQPAWWADKQIPILGINTGRLGFLADVNAQEIAHTIQALYEGDYTVDTRAVIQVETDGQPLQGYDCALNDVAILKRDNASMITIHATINGEPLTTYMADGLIMSARRPARRPTRCRTAVPSSCRARTSSH